MPVDVCFVLFLLARLFCSYICICVRLQIQVHCGSAVQFGRALPGFPITLSSAFDVDHTLFLDMQTQQLRKAICAENVQRSRDTIRWTPKHDEQLHIVMNAISDRDPYVEGSRNKHWWRQVEAGMCSAMQHKITIRTLKHRAKLLDARGVQRTSIGFFESSARGEAAYDGVKAAERVHDEAKAVENVANLRATQRLQILTTCIDKLDSTMRREIQQYKQLIRSCQDNYIK